jgi:hypothetical protein
MGLTFRESRDFRQGRPSAFPTDRAGRGLPIRRAVVAAPRHGRPMRDHKPQAQKTAFERGLQTFAQTPLGGKLFVSVFPAIDRRLIAMSRGRLSMGFGQTAMRPTSAAPATG